MEPGMTIVPGWGLAIVRGPGPGVLMCFIIPGRVGVVVMLPIGLMIVRAGLLVLTGGPELAGVAGMAEGVGAAVVAGAVGTVVAGVAAGGAVAVAAGGMPAAGVDEADPGGVLAAVDQASADTPGAGHPVTGRGPAGGIAVAAATGAMDARG
jgi:hypothetical protein